MTKIIFVHGMGNQKPSDKKIEGFRKAIENAAKKAGKPFSPSEPWWHLCHWAPVTQPDEDALYTKIGRPSVLLHRRLFTSEGDVVAYSRAPFSPNNYERIQQVFKASVTLCGTQATPPPGQKTPLIVISHSLGSVIASDGLWDLAKARLFPSNLELRALITIGSPIALFALRFGLANFNQPVGSTGWLNFFTSPPAKPEWANFYYNADLIAFPLKPLNQAYLNAVNKDVRLSPKGVWRKLLSLIPGVGIVSHDWYLDDPEVINEIVNQL